MKKLLYVFLAMTMAFAMVACSNSSTDPGSSPTTYTISFVAQDVDGAAVPAGDYTGTLPANKTVNVGTTYTLVTTDLPALVYDGDEDWIFLGWYRGNSTVSVGASITAATTLIAKFGPDTRITITFAIDNTAGGDYSSVTPAPVQILPGSSLGTDFPGPVTFLGTGDYLFDAWYDGAEPADGDTTFSAATTLTAKFKAGIRITFYLDEEDDPEDLEEVTHYVIESGGTFEDAGLTLPAGPDRSSEDLVFDKWTLATPDDPEEPLVAVSITTQFNSSTGVFARWLTDILTPDANAKAIVALENGSHVIAKFDIDIPNFDWENYSGITVDYKISGATSKVTIRSARLYGTYVDTDFTEDPNGVNVAQFDAHNAAYILNDKSVSWGTNYAALGFTKEDTWFTTTYPIDGTGKNSGYVDANLPGGANNASATEVYFGVGIAGVQTTSQATWEAGVIVQLIGDVKLKGTGSTPDIVGTLDFTGTGELAFAGYIDPIHYSWGSLTVTDTPTRPVYTPPVVVGVTPADDDYEVDLEALADDGVVLKNADAATGNYQPVLFIPISFPTQDTDQLNIASYVNVTVRADFYNEGDEKISGTSWWGYGNLVFVKNINSLAEYAALTEEEQGAYKVGEMYNLSQQTLDKAIPQGAKDDWEDFTGIILTNGRVTTTDDGGPTSWYVEVTEITFHAATE